MIITPVAFLTTNGQKSVRDISATSSHTKCEVFLTKLFVKAGPNTPETKPNINLCIQSAHISMDVR